MFEGVLLKAVLLKAKGLVEADGGEIVAHNRKLDDFDALAGGFEDSLDEQARSAGAAMAGPDVHSAEPALMGVFAAGVDAKGHDADDVRAFERAEDLRVGEPTGILFERRGVFIFVGAAESFGIEAETLETNFAEGFDVGGRELSDLDGHNYR